MRNSSVGWAFSRRNRNRSSDIEEEDSTSRRKDGRTAILENARFVIQESWFYI
jgi:hypothetical protein